MISENNGTFKIKNTLGMFELVKGVVLFMMLFAHTYLTAVDSAEINAGLYIFLSLFVIVGEATMPALFIISGYGYRKTEVKKNAIKQAKNLLFPYAITAIIAVLVRFIFYSVYYGNWIYSVKESLRLLAGSILGFPLDRYVFGKEITWCGPTWFLLALFVGNVVFSFLICKFEDKKLLVASFITACLGWLISLLGTVPFAFSQGLVATFYIGVGYYIKKNKLFITPISRKKKVSLGLASFVIVLTIKGFWGAFNMAYSIYTYGPISILAIGFWAVMIIYFFLHMNKYCNKFTSYVRSIGRYSLYLLCIHTVEMMGVGIALRTDFTNNWQGPHALQTLIIFATRVVVDMACTYYFIKIKEYFSNDSDNQGNVSVEWRKNKWQMFMRKS